MAVIRTWKGGGNNQASNPNDWGPTGAPRPGDTLILLSYSGAPPLNPASPVNSTMNVSGNALAGDPVVIGGGGSGTVNPTFNLSHSAVMTATEYGGIGTYNMVQNSTLNLLVRGGTHIGSASATINMLGNENLALTNRSAVATVNLAPGAEWHGTLQGQALDVFSGRTTVNGGPGSSFDNHGSSTIATGHQVLINTDVVGTGVFALTDVRPGGSVLAPPKMEFAHSVGANQAIINTGLVVLNKPGQFYGHILMNTNPGSPKPAEIDLHGLANADSYSYKNDILSIYSHNTVIDRLNLTMQPGHEFNVNKVAGGVNVVTTLDQMAPDGLRHLIG